jgi:endonuclease/exonuclease/phosphatase family metal-dependent hydrolase
MAFRVMNFNTRLLPPIAETGSIELTKILWGEVEPRARAIAQAILRDPWPDVIVFSEAWTFVERLAAKGTVFGTPLARDILISELAPLYHYATAMLPNPIPPIVKLMDSGLLMMAKRQPIPLRNQLPPEWVTGEPRIGFALFADAAKEDALSSKGVGVARFETSLGFVTIAFTHLQSAYDFVDESWDVRQRQLATIEELLVAAVGPRPWPTQEQILLIGDLNVAAIKSPEYSLHFENPNWFWGTNMHDGWRKFNSFEDPGVTQHAWNRDDPEPLQRNRLDYVFLHDPAPPYPPETYQTAPGTVPKLVAQHMRTTHRELSDHYALCADLHLWHLYCHPLVAYRTEYHLTPFLRFHLEDDTWMVWLRFPPGTYTFTKSDELELTIYSSDNLSDPWPPYQREKVDLSKIAGAEASWHEPGLSPEGEKYSLPKPFFVRVTVAADRHGEAAIGWRRHRGTSMDDAIGLLPQVPPQKTDFPEDRALGDRDMQWFSVKIRRALSGEPHTSYFFLENPTKGTYRLSLRSRSGKELRQAKSAGPRVRLSYSDPGEQTLYLVVERGFIGQENVLTGWRTSLTFIHPHFVRCDDETGWDKLGADEITLLLSADGFFAGTRDWDEADSGESLPLADTSKPGVSMEPAAYLKGVLAQVVEHDPDGDAVGWAGIDSLAADDPTDEETATFAVGTGRYSFLFHRSHWLPGD